jgi:hypothetical protein
MIVHLGFYCSSVISAWRAIHVIRRYRGARYTAVVFALAPHRGKVRSLCSVFILACFNTEHCNWAALAATTAATGGLHGVHDAAPFRQRRSHNATDIRGTTALRVRRGTATSCLPQAGCTALEGVDDAAQFRGVQHAFGTIGVAAGAQEQVWRVLAAVLHVACLEFGAEETAEGVVAVAPEAVTEVREPLLYSRRCTKVVRFLHVACLEFGAEEATEGVVAVAPEAVTEVRECSACTRDVYAFCARGLCGVWK